MAARNPQKLGTRGSLAWTQTLVNAYPRQLNAAVGPVVGIDSGTIEWVSPLASDEHAEFRDQGFLDRLGIVLERVPLPDFWPAGGPQWDALAKAPGRVLMVEAKAHLPEMTSSCAAGPRSLPRIRASLDLVRQAIGADGASDWTAPYYQYANRLAHLHLLRELNGIDAELVLLCFLNDVDMRGPSTPGEWMAGFDRVQHHLGIRPHPLLDHVHHVFVDVRTIGRPETAVCHSAGDGAVKA